MKESRRRTIDKACRDLKSAETRLETARAAFARELYESVEDENDSLGDVARTLKQLGRPMTRQRVFQIIAPLRRN